MLIGIPRATIKKITLKYSLKKSTEELWYIKYVTQKKAVNEEQKNKKEGRHVGNKQLNDKCKSNQISNCI